MSKRVLAVRIRGAGKHNIGKLFYAKASVYGHTDIVPTYDIYTKWRYGNRSLDRYFTLFKEVEE